MEGGREGVREGGDEREVNRRNNLLWNLSNKDLKLHENLYTRDSIVHSRAVPLYTPIPGLCEYSSLSPVSSAAGQLPFRNAIKQNIGHHHNKNTANGTTAYLQLN